MGRTGKRIPFSEYLSKKISNGAYKKVKCVILTLSNNPKHFLTALAVLGAQDKNISETIQFYEVLFRRFRLNSHLVDSYMAKEEWHTWTVVLLELSNILWKFREKFEPSSWLETNKKIYELTFKTLKSFDSQKRDHKECKCCSRLFTTILSNFTDYGKKLDFQNLHFPPLGILVEICEKNIGRKWHFFTPGRLIEEKINTIA